MLFCSLGFPSVPALRLAESPSFLLFLWLCWILCPAGALQLKRWHWICSSFLQKVPDLNRPGLAARARENGKVLMAKS
jgi:hypothetical protein